MNAIPLGAREPFPTSSPDAPSFGRIANSIHAMFPDVVAPSLMLNKAMGVGTSKSPIGVSLSVGAAARRWLHVGTNERIGIADFARAVGFYEHLILRRRSAVGGHPHLPVRPGSVMSNCPCLLLWKTGPYGASQPVFRAWFRCLAGAGRRIR